MADEIQYVTSYKEVSDELGKKLIKLYNAKIFPRQGKIFADMLFQSGIEAGSYLAALADIEERMVKINLATNAMIHLNQTEYLVNVMSEAGYYAPYQVAEIREYLDVLTRAMKDLLISAYEQMRTKNVQTVVARAPLQSIPTSKPKSDKTNSDKPKSEKSKPAPPAVVISADPDGFNVPAHKPGNEGETDNKI